MTETKPRLQVVEDDTIADYPISATVRLDSHFFVPWNLKRWRGSEFRRHGYADPAVGFFGMELFFVAQDETPIGTLPVDDDSLAFLLRMPVERWKELKARAQSPLHGWYQVQCDNGQMRLAHKVVTEVALDAIGAKARNDAKHADDRMRKRLNTIAKHLRESINGAAMYADNEELVNQISDWVEVAYPGGSATVKRIKEALNALSTRR
ncbi:hypothetical protein [Shimia sagamensis]|uniref:Uncharacterized protein n=1 Tax=Shimia sagamensis TaxID=1566352 RepID=A0ABY1PDL9_9RHOB|nr:hypothetical protein [Shimia sagamensis]SMP32105.1 hypothetical protein SAMN06265373_108129 [Shimia sagamensis]